MSAEDLDRWLAKVDRGRKALAALGQPFPGGDSCRAAVVRGLAEFLRLVDNADHEYPDDHWSPDERAALDWLRMWLDAGTMMLDEEDR